MNGPFIIGVCNFCEMLGEEFVCFIIPINFARSIHLTYRSTCKMFYFQYGLKQKRSAGQVDTSKVYSSGMYTTGPDYTFKTFDAASHFVDLEQFGIFTADRLEVIHGLPHIGAGGLRVVDYFILGLGVKGIGALHIRAGVKDSGTLHMLGAGG